MKINTALILCAGFGKRLNPITLNTPKPLLELNNITMLESCINLIENLGIKNNSEFEQYLKNNNIAIDYIQKKIQIEILWNQLIYDKYISQVNINQTKLKEKLKKIDNKKNKKMYFLSEILFDKENNSNFKKKLTELKTKKVHGWYIGRQKRRMAIGESFLCQPLS